MNKKETKITPETIITIMTATGKFEHSPSTPSSRLLFWDDELENTVSIAADSSLEQVIQWLTKYFEREYTDRGQRNARIAIKQALGI